VAADKPERFRELDRPGPSACTAVSAKDLSSDTGGAPIYLIRNVTERDKGNA
jgi:hypothetical protein